MAEINLWPFVLGLEVIMIGGFILSNIRARKRTKRLRIRVKVILNGNEGDWTDVYEHFS